MQNRIEEKSLAIVLDLSRAGGRLTGKMLGKAFATVGRTMVRKTVGRDMHGNVTAHGKMSVRNLMRKNGAYGVDDFTLAAEDRKQFKHFARKHGVDYAFRKNIDDPQKMTVLLSARSKDVIAELFKEYSSAVLKKENERKPSILQKIKEGRSKEKVLQRERQREKTKDDLML